LIIVVRELSVWEELGGKGVCARRAVVSEKLDKKTGGKIPASQMRRPTAEWLRRILGEKKRGIVMMT
jgi:transposase